VVRFEPKRQWCWFVCWGPQVEFARLTLAEYPIRPPHKEVAMVHLG